jgi:hypothetical protein
MTSKKLLTIIILIGYVFISVLVIIFGAIFVKGFPTQELSEIIATTLAPIFMVCQYILHKDEKNDAINEKNEDKHEK